MAKGDQGTLRDLVACRQKETCEHVATCDAAYERLSAKTVRKSSPDDPVLVTASSVAETRFNAREVTASYRNNSAKATNGIKFRYFCANNFDEPVGSGGLIDQDTIAAGASHGGTWTIYEGGCTKVSVVVTDVHFVDGQTWAP